MQTRARLVRYLAGVLFVSIALWSAACGEDEPQPIIDDSNDCGGEETLTWEGEEAEKDAPCGECGVLDCHDDDPNTLVCEDPGENACGGCDELAADPGDDCTAPDGEEGIYVCAGDNAVECDPDALNACGGTEELDEDPGDYCGPCLLDIYQCDGVNDVACSNNVGCPQPSDVSATQGERTDAVEVTWRGSVHAAGYRIYRDGDEIEEVSAGQLSYVDDGADESGPPESVDVDASTDRIDGVQVDWEIDEPAYAEHEYEVEIVFPQETSERSESTVGYRDLAIDRFELTTGGELLYQGEDTGYLHEDAARATVQEVTPDQVDEAWDFVTMEIEDAPEITDAEEHDYDLEVFVEVDGSEESTSGQATGQRDHGEAGYYWESADEETADPEDFEQLEGCDDILTCTDEDFPVQSDVAERFYQFVVDGPGIEETTSDAVAGRVDSLEIVVEDIETQTFTVGESVQLNAWVESEEGDPVGWEDLELTLDFSDEWALAEPVPETVDTDGVGEATVEVTFDQEVDDTTVDWQADHPRFDGGEVTQGPFDVVVDQQADGQNTTLEQRATTTEMLADGEDATDIEIEVRDGEGEPIAGAAIGASTDPEQGADLDCDSHTDNDGFALCTIDADEPGRYDVNLDHPTTASLDEPVVFYATADDYPEISGDVRDVGIAGDYAVFGGEGLEEGGDDIGATAVVDRVTGEVDGELDEEFGIVYALEGEGDELFVLGDAKLARYEYDGTEFVEEADTGADSDDLLALGENLVFAFDSDDVGVRALDGGDLSEEDSSAFDVLTGGELTAVGAFGDVAVGLGDELGDADLDQTEYHVMLFIPGIGTEFMLETDDVEGDLEYFDVTEDGVAFVTGDFTEITGHEVDGLARLIVDENDELVADEDFVPGQVADTHGGVWHDEGTVWSTGLFDGTGLSFEADTGDLAGDELDNDVAWGGIVEAPRHLLLVDDVEEASADDYDVVIRPDVESSVIGE